MQSLTLNVRVDSNDKKQFEKFCSSVGMNVSTVINMFIKKVLKEQKMPFEISTQSEFEKYAINEHVFFLNTKNENYLNWLYFTLNQESYFNLMQNLNRNAAQPGLSQPDINRIKIRIPSEDVVIKFNEFVEPILNTVFTLAQANKNLVEQRDLLLPRLMSGKLEV